MNNDQISMLLAYMIQSQSSGGFVQNFLFHFLLSAISAIIGAHAAYFLLAKRELQAKHESNLNSLNMLWLNAIDAFSHLEARKRSYIDNSGLMSDPIDRALCLLTYHENIKAFAVPVETTFLLARAKKRTKHLIWSNAEASLLINENHRSLIMTWQMRNKINEQIKNLILDNQSIAQLTDRDLKERIGSENMIYWINFTEKSIIFTDDLLTQLYSLLDELPKITKEIIPANVLKKYDSIMHQDLNENYRDILNRAPETDYKLVEKIFFRPASRI